MSIHRMLSIAALVSVTVYSSNARSQSCNKDFLMSLANDKNQTHLQRLKAAENQCKGKVIAVVGVVDDVDSVFSMKIVGTDGLKYDVYLSPANQCGDMHKLQKGQRISISGKISGAYYHWPKYSIENAICSK